MTGDARAAFLAGERPEEVLVYLAESGVSDVETLAERGEDVPGGVLFVLDGDRGRRVAERAIGTDPMELASAAMDSTGEIDLERFVGTCPAAENPAPTARSGPTPTDVGGEDHALRYVFAFAEERNAEVGGIYAEGDVIHAYAVCECGAAYSDRWVANGEGT